MSRTSKGAKGSKKSAAKKPKAGKAKSRSRALVKPSQSDQEQEHFIETLRANRQLAPGSGPLPPGATHVVETDEAGTTRVVRKRYSAF